MKLFLFEFATCGEDVDDSIAVEGLAMFQSLYNGFSKLCDVLAFVREEYSYLKLPIDRLDSIEMWLEDSDLFLIVAPEDEGTLLKLTSLAEKYSFNLGSSSKAIAITSDKWKLYKKLKGKVQVPKTSKRPLGERFVVKPRTSCGGSGVHLASELPRGYIAQEYIEGIALSVSLMVGHDVLPFSVNEQILRNFAYIGAVVPARVGEDVMREVEEEAVRAVECIRVLHGYVGVDVVYSDQPYVIEVNARFTTPGILFDQVYGISAAELIWNNVFGDVEKDVKRVKGRTAVARYKMVKGSCKGSAIARVGNICLSAERI